MKLTKSISLIIFGIMAIAQWFIPVNMITQQQDILNTGKLYKFKTAPFDPYDAFRGKYIHLNFDNNFIQIKNHKNYNTNDEVFITFSDSLGYAKVESISKTKPLYGDYLKVKVNYVNQFKDEENKQNKKIYFSYPFNRYYMNEYKAKEAESAYAESFVDDKKYKTYALVAIKNGESVLKDVMINDVSIKEYVKN